MGTTFLDSVTAVTVPYFRRGFAHDPDGKRYVALWPADDSVFYRGGIASRPDGAMLIAPGGTIATTQAGVAATSRGEVVAAVDTPAVIHDGQGLLEDGTLCVSETD